MSRALPISGLLLLLASVAQAQKPPTAEQKQTAKAHFQQGRAYYDAGAYDDAIREYGRAFELVPLPELLFNIGQAQRLKGDKAPAIAAYERYLAAAPDGPLADEARNHIALLRARMQVEAAEAARKQAAEEAAAARRRADEAEAARRRAEADAAARGRAQQGDDDRLRRVAAEEAERARRRKEAEAAAQEATTAGRGLRVTGVTLGSVGVAALAFTAIAYAGPVQSKLSSVKKFNTDPSAGWGQGAYSDVTNGRAIVIALDVAGAVLVTSGVGLYFWGRARRARAMEQTRGVVALAPVIGPSTAALAVAGRF